LLQYPKRSVVDRSQNKAAGESGIVDPLTGVRSLSSLTSALDETMPAVLLDIDGLRRVNDQLGHLVGDDVLRHLGAWLTEEAEVLKGQVFRVAGDKFLLLLRGRTIEDAITIANRIVFVCPSLALANVSRADTPATLTISAVVFTANSEVPSKLRTIIDMLTDDLYRAELAVGRTYSNVTISSI
jgi:diguanylate cyclase (GGDEF)-like protein